MRAEAGAPTAGSAIANSRLAVVIPKPADARPAPLMFPRKRLLLMRRSYMVKQNQSPFAQGGSENAPKVPFLASAAI